MNATIDIRALAAISHSVSTEETRYYLNGVCVEIDESGCTYVATDGHQLSATRREYAEPSQLVGRWIIPAEICRHFKTTRRRDCFDAVLTQVEGGKLALEYMGQSVIFAPIDGTFPDWRRVVPSSTNGETAQFSTKILSQLSKVAKTLGNDCGQLLISHNGHGPALIGFGCDDDNAFGVLMPFRGAGPECLPAWVHHVPEELKIAAE